MQRTLWRAPYGSAPHGVHHNHGGVQRVEHSSMMRPLATRRPAMPPLAAEPYRVRCAVQAPTTRRVS